MVGRQQKLVRSNSWGVVDYKKARRGEKCTWCRPQTHDSKNTSAVTSSTDLASWGTGSKSIQETQSKYM